MTEGTVVEGKKDHFGSKDHRIKQLDLLLKRVQKAAAVFAGTSVGSILGEATEAVEDAIKAIPELPADWKPAARSSGRKAKFVPVAGVAVQIKKKKVGEYAVLSAEDLATLEVVAVNGKLASCRSASGAVTNVRISHLAPRK